MYKNADKQQISQLIEEYFEALYRADAERLRGVFHPQARYVNTVAGDEMNYSLEEYLAVVRLRTAPAKTQQARKESITSIDIGGSQMAFVNASMVMMGREYVDFLTLTQYQNSWKILSKVFSYTPITS